MQFALHQLMIISVDGNSMHFWHGIIPVKWSNFRVKNLRRIDDGQTMINVQSRPACIGDVPGLTFMQDSSIIHLTSTTESIHRLFRPK